MNGRRKLGQVLIEQGLLTEKQLRKALSSHLESGRRLGEELVAMGVVSENDLVKVLSDLLHFRRYNSAVYKLDTNLSGFIPVHSASEYKAVPICEQHGSLIVAMVDPLDFNAVDALESMSIQPIVPVIVTMGEFEQLFSSMYGAVPDYDAHDDGSDILKHVEKSTSVELKSLQEMTEEVPVVRMVNWMITEAIKQSASDIHLSPEKSTAKLRFRIDGKLKEFPSPPAHLVLPITSRIKILSNMDIAQSMVPQDGRMTVRLQNKEINIRASSFPTIHGENIVLRILDTSAGLRTLNDLGMGEDDRRMIEKAMVKPYGLILSTGPTGSGKSTSLYAILQKLICPEVNIITIEDPVEYRVDNIRQAQLNKKAGMTFASALRSILRQDPDIIMVGEIRDSETAVIAHRAAMTGHLVLSTVHTNDSAGAISRLEDMGIAPFIISSTLLCVFAQRLVRKVCPHCCEEWNPPEKVLQDWGLDASENITFVKTSGCLKCTQIGYKGRTAVFEVLLIDDEVKEMIIAEKTSHEIAMAMVANGKLRTLKQDAARKLVAHVTTLEEATSVVMVGI